MMFCISEDSIGISVSSLGLVSFFLSASVLPRNPKTDHVLSKEIITPIEQFLTKNKTLEANAVRSEFGDKYDYGDIRMVVNYLLHQKQKAE